LETNNENDGAFFGSIYFSYPKSKRYKKDIGIKKASEVPEALCPEQESLDSHSQYLRSNACQNTVKKSKLISFLSSLRPLNAN